nr:DUF4179 domain-containing protein [Bacillus pinisoli]
MTDIKERLEEFEKEREQVKKKKFIAKSVVAACLAVAILIGFVTNGFSYLYYTWLGWNQLENEEILNYLKSGVGEPLNLEAEKNGIKIKIKTAIADEYQTLIYYEIEDTNEDPKQYAINMYEGVTVLNENSILNNQADPMNRFGFELETSEKKGDNVYNGVLSLLPLKEESGTIKLEISKLTEMKENPNDNIFHFNQLEQVEVEWSFDIPVAKQASIEQVIDKEINIDGIPVTLEKVYFAPTVTMLQYKYRTDDRNRYLQNINIDYLEIGDKKSPAHYFHSMPIHNDSFLKSFDTLYFEQSKEMNVHFSSIYYHVNDHVSFPFDAKGTFPQTVEYLGTSITFEEIKMGDQTKLILTDAPPQDRVYESLHFEFKTDNESDFIYANYLSTDEVLIDREGKQYKPSEYNYYHSRTEPPRYYTLRYEVEIFKENSEEAVIPTKFIINGYSYTKYLDENVNIQLD